MSRFGSNPTLKRTARKADTHNLAGGQAYSQSPKVELTSLLLTSFVTNQSYRSADDGLARLRELLTEVDPLFAAKAAVYARNEFGMRSISHVVAGELAHSVKGEQWTKRFYEKVARRPDDLTEIVAYYLGTYGKPFPNSLKKGIRRAVKKFDAYQLGKWRQDNGGVSLVDALNLSFGLRGTLPEPKRDDPVSQLLAGKLRSEDTFESKLSEAGKQEDKGTAKAEAWAELVRTRKIGYMALLKNLRNIVEQAPEVVPEACELLTDERLISNSLVLPFRYLVALNEISDTRVVRALSRAIDISLGNIPELPNSLVVIDHSGSMHQHLAGGSLECKWVGDIFAAALFKRSAGDVMVFGDTAGYVRGLNPDDSTLSLARAIGDRNHGYGTNFRAIFERADKPYERVVIFSDMQGWMGYYSPADTLGGYGAKTGARPWIYSFDLAGFGTTQFPQNRVVQLAGFSEKIFDTMRLVEQDREALIHRIEAVEI